MKVVKKSDEWRTVAPGVAVGLEEYEQRYSMLNLEALRVRMKPEIFRAFVLTIGTIRSIPDTDVNDLTRQEGI